MASLTYIVRAENLNGRLRKDLMSPDGAVRADVQRRCQKVRDEAKRLLAARTVGGKIRFGPVGTGWSSGSLGASIRYVTVERHGQWVGQVGSDLKYALWVEEGTGVYGPRRAPFGARSGSYMKFRLRTGRLVYARYSRGQPGKHYLRDARRAFR